MLHQEKHIAVIVGIKVSFDIREHALGVVDDLAMLIRESGVFHDRFTDRVEVDVARFNGDTVRALALRPFHRPRDSNRMPVGIEVVTSAFHHTRIGAP